MIVINFYSDNPAAIAGKFVNNFNTSLDDESLVDYDSGVASGFTLDSSQIFTPLSGAGRNIGSDALTQVLNAEVLECTPFSNASFNISLPPLTPVLQMDVEVYLTTPLPQLTSVQVIVELSLIHI